jgi:hypothetical protein
LQITPQVIVGMNQKVILVPTALLPSRIYPYDTGARLYLYYTESYGRIIRIDTLPELPPDSKLILPSISLPASAASPYVENGTDALDQYHIANLIASPEAGYGISIMKISNADNYGLPGVRNRRYVPLFKDSTRLINYNTVAGIYWAAGAFFVSSPKGLHRITYEGEEALVLSSPPTNFNWTLFVKSFGTDTVIAGHLSNVQTGLSGVYMSTDGGRSFTQRFNNTNYLSSATIDKIGPYVIALYNKDMIAIKWGRNDTICHLPTKGLPRAPFTGIYAQNGMVYVMSQAGVYKKPLREFLKPVIDTLR